MIVSIRSILDNVGKRRTTLDNGGRYWTIRAGRSALGFLGYEFRFVRNHYGEGKYLTFGPSMKSVKKVCAKVKEQTLSIMKPVKNEEIVQRVNKILVGWDNYFQCGGRAKGVMC